MRSQQRFGCYDVTALLGEGGMGQVWQPGTTLGAYSVTAKLGEGGMGEVYQARDTKLDRDVALKVLPEAFTADPDRLARFEREAKAGGPRWWARWGFGLSTGKAYAPGPSRCEDQMTSVRCSPSG